MHTSRLLTLVLLLAAAVISAACGSDSDLASSSNPGASPGANSVAGGASSSSVSSDAANVAALKVIQTSTLQLSIANVVEAYGSIAGTTRAMGGYVARAEVTEKDDRPFASVQLRVPSTRHEELLFDRTDLQQVWKLRRVLNALEGGGGLELLIDKLRSTKSNTEFLKEIAKAPGGMGT